MSGVVEEWSIGVVEEMISEALKITSRVESSLFPITPALQYSITPIFSGDARQ